MEIGFFSLKKNVLSSVLHDGQTCVPRVIMVTKIWRFEMNTATETTDWANHIMQWLNKWFNSRFRSGDRPTVVYYSCTQQSPVGGAEIALPPLLWWLYLFFLSFSPVTTAQPNRSPKPHMPEIKLRLPSYQSRAKVSETMTNLVVNCSGPPTYIPPSKALASIVGQSIHVCKSLSVGECVPFIPREFVTGRETGWANRYEATTAAGRPKTGQTRWTGDPSSYSYLPATQQFRGRNRYGD